MLRRIAAWILRRLGCVCIQGSRGFPDEPMWPVGMYVQRGDDGEEEGR